MFWTLNRLKAQVEDLTAYRYRERRTLAPLLLQDDEEGAVGLRYPIHDRWTVVKIGDTWKGRDRYVWLKLTIEIPAKWANKQVVGLFDFGKTGAGNNSQFEALLFLNGEPYQGIDSNHQEVLLPKDAAGHTVECMVRLWSGLEGGGKPTEQTHVFRQAELAMLDAATDDLYYTAKTMLGTVAQLDESDHVRHSLLTAVDRSFQHIDWSKPGDAMFYASTEVSSALLRKELDTIPHHHPVTVHAIGHTHIDLAWLWRLRHTREKAARSFSTVLRLMEQYPEYVFLQSQPQLYAYLKQDYPDLYEQIKTRIREGRWEAGGGMWVEADCNIPSGESLVRQILYGTRFFEQEFGVNNDYLWLPDVFGYSWALPQILRKSGVQTFMTTKISWNQYNRMPHDTFIWRGIDGSEIVTHFITTPDQEDNVWYTYNGEMKPSSVQGIWNNYRNKEISDELLLAYGYGDGGGGVNRDMLETSRRLRQMPGLPRTVPGRVDDYFHILHRKLESTDRYVHVWDGELYLEYHRGTYTSQAYNKRMNRKLELLYRDVEYKSAQAALLAGDWSFYPAERIREGWKIILRNQFHDIIPGSSIREVYEDSSAEYAEAEQIGRELLDEANAKLFERGQERLTFTVSNNSSFDRSGDLVLIPVVPDKEGYSVGIWRHPGGAEAVSQRTNEGWLVQVGSLLPFGTASLMFEERDDEATQVSEDVFAYDKQTGLLTTPYYDIWFDSHGRLKRLLDRSENSDVLADGEFGNVLQVFEDKPLAFDAWDIDIYYQMKYREVTNLRTIQLVENGPLRAVLLIEWTYGESVIQQKMIVYAYSRRIDFRTEIDWHEQQQLLKVAFPVNVRATEATYDIQFGNVRRPTHWNTSWDYARFETVGHQWADLSERGYGVSILNDCKYGYDIKDHTMRLSLIKSAVFPDPQADQGSHHFTYALYPHGGDWYQGETPREAWLLNEPLQAIAAQESKRQNTPLFRITSSSVMIDAVKKAEDGDALIVRLHEYAGRRGKVEVECGFPAVRWEEVDLRERSLELAGEGTVIPFDLGPYEIKTFRITCQ